MRLQFFKYSIPFKQPFVTSSQTFENRDGVLAVLKKDGITAMGEAAPLPGFSAETTQNVIQQVRAQTDAIHELFLDDITLENIQAFSKNNKLHPSLWLCLFTIGSIFLAQKTRQPLQHILWDKASDSFSLNTVIDLSGKSIAKTVAGKIDEGFGTIKIKAGTEPEYLIDQIKHIRDHHPDVKIRLDANRSWKMEQAIGLFKQLAALNIEYCEEPLANPDKDSLAELKNHSSVPIALDESLTDTFTIPKAASVADVLIIKPMVHGPVIDTVQKITAVKNVKTMCTSSLESSLGRLMTAALTAGLGSTGTAHGLATGQLLANDLWSDDQFIRNGRFHLPGPDKIKKLMESGFSNITTQELEV